MRPNTQQKPKCKTLNSQKRLDLASSTAWATKRWKSSSSCEYVARNPLREPFKGTLKGTL